MVAVYGVLGGKNQRYGYAMPHQFSWIFRIKRDFENRTIRSMRLGGDAKGRTNKSSISVVCYVLKYSGVLRRYSRKPLCSDSSKIGRSPLHGVQRDVNYKRFWEYFRIFEQFQSIFGPQLDTLNSKIGLETPKLLIFNIFQTDRLDFNFIFGDFFRYRNRLEWSKIQK